VYGFEQLMRRAILRAPRAALMSFAVFAFLNSFDMAPPNGTAVMLSPHHKAGRPLFMTGAHSILQAFCKHFASILHFAATPLPWGVVPSHRRMHAHPHKHADLNVQAASHCRTISLLCTR
jgi:hypothetical protein